MDMTQAPIDLPAGHQWAYCFASGEVRFGRRIPDGAIAIGRGPRRSIHAEMEAACRHAYDDKTLLVPGVPEAADQSKGIAALERWIAWLAKRPKPGLTFNTKQKETTNV